MRFCIADSFTKALGKLNAQEQSAAKITVFDLQQDPSAPGFNSIASTNQRTRISGLFGPIATSE